MCVATADASGVVVGRGDGDSETGSYTDALRTGTGFVGFGYEANSEKTQLDPFRCWGLA